MYHQKFTALAAILFLVIVNSKCNMMGNFNKLTPEYHCEVDYLEQCRNMHDLAIEAPEMSVIQIDDGDFAFNGIINFTKTVHSPWTITMTMKKCASKTDARTCQEFFKTVVTKVCDKLREKNQPWSDFVHQIKLDEKSCPIEPEEFYAKDIAIGKAAMKFFPVGEAVYKVHIEGHSGNTLIHCFDAQFFLTQK